MEKVQFQLESTLPELKDLYDKGLFTRSEINEITKRRTAFETALIRRVTRKEDFFRYAEYEINLERLRKVRWKKLRYHINRPPPSASTYSIPRRTLYILKRATAKFPGDLAVWLAYVEFAAREGMTKVVAKGLNSALHHHPLSSTLYLLLSYHHLHPGAPLPRSTESTTDDGDEDKADQPSGFSLEGTGPARTTLLLGLRMLPQSHDLWREYIKLELGWVEALRRRWAVLGIAPKEGDTGFDGDAAALAGGDGAFGPEGEDARRAILSGQLVLHALQSSLTQILPASQEKTETGVVTGMDYRNVLLKLLRSYPSPLRTKAVTAVYSDLEAVATRGEEEGARARLILVTRQLYDRPYESGQTEDGNVVLSGAELVEAMGAAGRAVRSLAKSAGPTFVDVAGSWLVDQIHDMASNQDLQRFLFGTLTALTKPSLSAPATLLVRHLTLSRQFDPQSYLSTSRTHAARYPTDPALQLAHVAAEIASEAQAADVRSICAAAARQVTISGLSPEEQADVLALWRNWAEFESKNGGDWSRLLRDSLRLGAGVPALHPTLLADYYTHLLRIGIPPRKALDDVSRTYSPSAVFYGAAFDTLSTRSNAKADLAALYMSWRAACKSPAERVNAVLIWAAWLLERGIGLDAARAKDVVQHEVRGTEEEERLETGWKRLLDGAQEDDVMASDSDSDDEADAEEGSETLATLSDTLEGAESEESGDLEFAI